MRLLTTIRDAEQQVRDWTERYSEQPTDAEVHRAARALVAYLGGYGADAEALDEHGTRLTEGFDLDSALAPDPAAVALGRRGGHARSPAKTAAARRNATQPRPRNTRET